MKGFNCNDRCGICCIVCCFIPLTDDEADGYMNVLREDKPGKKMMKLVTKYIPDLNQKLEVCFYFDPYKKECVTYNKRPETCKRWNCKSKDYSKEYAGVMKRWNELKEGENV